MYQCWELQVDSSKGVPNDVAQHGCSSASGPTIHGCPALSVMLMAVEKFASLQLLAGSMSL